MNKKRAAIVASAGFGLLVSALVLHKWNRKRHPRTEADSAKAVVLSEVDGHDRTRNHIADAV
ncbi:MAG: hypothetical protein H7Y17_01330 [Chlorobia bacterium]|nr:hypothetical protein [Fimbriimonadaceae bacterium]